MAAVSLSAPAYIGTPGRHRSVGISVSYHDPLVVGTHYLGSLNGTMDSWQHTKQAFGGWWSASFSFAARYDQINDWARYGLARHIVTRNEAQERIFEGLVNSVTIRVGAVEKTIGPLLGISNDLQLEYQTVRYDTNPPVGGERRVTAFALDAASVARYGILRETVQGGEMPTSLSNHFRNLYLAERKDPESTERLGSQGGSLSVTVEVIGYAQLLVKHPYNQIVLTGTQDVSAKIAAALAAQPNSLIAATTNYIQANALQVKRYENENRPAETIIKECASLGDLTDRRWTFGIYGLRQAHYAPVPSTYEYEHWLGDSRQQFIHKVGRYPIEPWNLEPARWIFVPDMIADLFPGQELQRDPRMVFIESLTFTAPDQVEINGGKLLRTDQRLARYGLGIYL